MSTSPLRKLALLPACFFMLLTQPLACAAQPASSGDLASALQAASERDPELAQWPWRQTAAQAGLQVAQGLTPAPAAVSINHLSDRLNQNLGRREWEVEVGAPMWLPGQHRASIELAQQTLNDTQARLTWRRWQLAGELRERWWQLAQARAQADLAHHRHQTAQALEADVRRRYQAGDLARVDANLARTETLAAQSEWLATQQVVRQLEQAYAALTGANAPATLQAETLPALADAHAMADLQSHPQAQAAQAQLALAARKLALADASQRTAPELALRWSQQRGDALSPNAQAVGIKITLPLSSAPQLRQDSATVRADLAQAERAQTQAHLQIAQALQHARTELAMSEQQLTLTQERCLLTGDNLQLAQRAFSLGEQDLNALLRARITHHEAQAAQAHQTLARQAAISRLRQALGLLPEESHP